MVQILKIALDIERHCNAVPKPVNFIEGILGEVNVALGDYQIIGLCRAVQAPGVVIKHMVKEAAETRVQDSARIGSREALPRLSQRLGARLKAVDLNGDFKLRQEGNEQFTVPNSRIKDPGGTARGKACGGNDATRDKIGKRPGVYVTPSAFAPATSPYRFVNLTASVIRSPPFCYCSHLFLSPLAMRIYLDYRDRPCASCAFSAHPDSATELRFIKIHDFRGPIAAHDPPRERPSPGSVQDRAWHP